MEKFLKSVYERYFAVHPKTVIPGSCALGPRTLSMQLLMTKLLTFCSDLLKFRMDIPTG